jgi:hypothetical protein
MAALLQWQDTKNYKYAHAAALLQRQFLKQHTSALQSLAVTKLHARVGCCPAAVAEYQTAYDHGCPATVAGYQKPELFGPGHFFGLGLGLRLKSEIRTRTRTRTRT